MTEWPRDYLRPGLEEMCAEHHIKWIEPDEVLWVQLGHLAATNRYSKLGETYFAWRLMKIFDH